MSQIAYRTARDLVHRFADESDDLLQRRAEALDYQDCETFIRLGLDAYHWLLRADGAFRSAVFAGAADFDPAVEATLQILCSAWLQRCNLARPWIQSHRDRGSEIELLAEFEECCREMQAIVQAQGAAETEEMPQALVELRDRALEEFRNGQTSEFV